MPGAPSIATRKVATELRALITRDPTRNASRAYFHDAPHAATYPPRRMSADLAAPAPAPPRRHRAHGAVALGLGRALSAAPDAEAALAADPVLAAEAYELRDAAASERVYAPPAGAADARDLPASNVPPARAPFDPLTYGEHAWMFTALVFMLATTAAGVYISVT
ncbi:hypothetical protein MSPP1_002900 [Malassezia sp. CBS 17886]|nr:hypothetical protein MSPP1_002900 [Malassezia sp. CBS 17886]